MTGPMCGTRSGAWTTSRPSCRRFGRPDFTSSLTVEGTPRPLPAGLDLSAFRIVQEALTNVLKHAGPATATVRIRYERSRLHLTISDDGSSPVERDPDPLRARYGHLGMRERVALFGGSLRVGPRLGDGYEVVVSLPLDADPT